MANPSVTFAGHGSLDLDTDPPTFTMPGGTRIFFFTQGLRTMWSGDADRLAQLDADQLATLQDQASQVVNAGETCWNYTLSDDGYSDGLTEAPGVEIVTSVSDRLLSDLAAEHAGKDLYWVCCRAVLFNEQTGGSWIGVDLGEDVGQRAPGDLAATAEFRMPTSRDDVKVLAKGWGLDEPEQIKILKDLYDAGQVGPEQVQLVYAGLPQEAQNGLRLNQYTSWYLDGLGLTLDSALASAREEIGTWQPWIEQFVAAATPERTSMWEQLTPEQQETVSGLDENVYLFSQVLAAGEQAQEEAANTWVPDGDTFAYVAEVNQSAVKSADDDATLDIQVGGFLVLIGDGHDASFVDWVQGQPDYARGSLTVERARFGAGSLSINGIPPAKQGIVESAINEFSKKDVEFV